MHLAFRVCLALLVGCATLSPYRLHAADAIFRSEEFHFRFAYPADWVQKPPRGPNTRALVLAPAGGSNCTIVVHRRKDFAALSQADIDKKFFGSVMTEADWKTMAGDSISGLKVFERRLDKVDGHLAQFAVSKMPFQTASAILYMVQTQWMTVTPGLFWHFICTAGGTDPTAADKTFETMRPTFDTILLSLVFEH